MCGGLCPGQGCAEGTCSKWGRWGSRWEATETHGASLEPLTGNCTQAPSSDSLCLFKCLARRQSGQTLLKVAVGPLTRLLLRLPEKQLHVLREHNYILCETVFFLLPFPSVTNYIVIILLLNKYLILNKSLSSKVIENSRILGPMTRQAWFSSKQR